MEEKIEPSGLMSRLKTIVESTKTERIITGLIVINAIVLGLETYPALMEKYGAYIRYSDKIILAIFVVEILARIAVHRLAFFKSAWNLFDFFVVGIALVPATGNLSILRALRIIRALRLVSTIKSMRRVIGGLIDALPGMGSIIALLVLVFYVFSVIATKLFAETHPQWFADLGESAYSLFQIMTLESWSMGIVRPVMEVHPWAWAFFVPFILITSFTVLNLFIGIIVDAMQRQHESELHAEMEETEEDVRAILHEVKALRAEIAELRPARLDKD